MSTLTAAETQAIRDYLVGRHISVGLGTRQAARPIAAINSIAAINLALTGELTDAIPDCMSVVVGTWVLRIQDSMPDELRNSPEWRELLPLAAGTGRAFEKERWDLVMRWLWGTVLPYHQPAADHWGYGVAWANMCAARAQPATHAAASATSAALAAASAAFAAANVITFSGTCAAAYATQAADACADAYATNYARDAVSAVLTRATFAASCAANNAYDVAGSAAAWDHFAPAGLLRALIKEA